MTFVGLSVVGKVYAYWEREMKWFEAEANSLATGKPILNVGCGDQPRYIADINLDLEPSMLPNFVQHDLTQPLPFVDKQFGSAVAFHVLEHVDDPQAVLYELDRVADRVYVGLPPFWSPDAYLSSEHKWVFVEGKVYPISGASNLGILMTLAGLGLTYYSVKKWS